MNDRQDTQHNCQDGQESPCRAQAKLWGTTELLCADECVELWRLTIRQGGYSSRHLHQSKSNGFLVVCGRLMVICYLDQTQQRKVLDPAAGICFVPAGVEHRFLALEEATTVYEIYYATPNAIIRQSDIVRRDGNGVFTGNAQDFPG